MFPEPSDGLKPYLKYSAALHAGLALGAAFLLGRNAATSSQVYRIDFIGPTAGIINRDIEAQEKKTAARAAGSRRIPPQTDRDAFSRKRRRTLLPRPSILSSSEEKPEPPASAAAQVPDRVTSDAQAGAADAAVSADMPNFPYPWYISQVRGALWSRWSERMPYGGGETMVGFAILRNGAVTDLRVESSSGEKSFDDKALSAAQASAPFPPLPRGFAESFLKIHVRFTSP